MAISQTNYVDITSAVAGASATGLVLGVIVRAPEFINAAGDYEKNPSFDFDLSFTRTITPSTKPVTTIEPELVGI